MLLHDMQIFKEGKSSQKVNEVSSVGEVERQAAYNGKRLLNRLKITVTLKAGLLNTSSLITCYLLLVVDGLHKRQLYSCPYLPGEHPISFKQSLMYDTTLRSVSFRVS